MSESEHLSPNQRAWRRFTRNRPAVVSLVFVSVLALLVLISPWITPYKPDAVSDAQFQPPSSQHWFGTDVHGRDQLARTLTGARISLLVGGVRAGVRWVLGVLWGVM